MKRVWLEMSANHNLLQKVNMKKLLIVTLISLFTFPSFAQLSGSELDGERQIRVFFKVGLVYNAVKYPDAVGAGVISADVDMAESNFEFRGYQVSHRFPVLGDLVFPFIGEIVGFTFKNQPTPGIEGNLGSTNLGTLLLGWHNHAWAFISNDFINVAGGFHWGDYMYQFQRYEGADERFFKRNALRFADEYTDPSGYYLGYGPALIMDVALVGNYIFHYEGAYSFSARILKDGNGTAPKNSPNPIFLNQHFEIRYNSLFVGAEYCAVLKNNEAPHAGRRLAFILGYSF